MKVSIFTNIPISFAKVAHTINLGLSHVMHNLTIFTLHKPIPILKRIFVALTQGRHAPAKSQQSLWILLHVSDVEISCCGCLFLLSLLIFCVWMTFV